MKCITLHFLVCCFFAIFLGAEPATVTSLDQTGKTVTVDFRGIPVTFLPKDFSEQVYRTGSIHEVEFHCGGKDIRKKSSPCDFSTPFQFAVNGNIERINRWEMPVYKDMLVHHGLSGPAAYDNGLGLEGTANGITLFPLELRLRSEDMDRLPVLSSIQRNDRIPSVIFPSDKPYTASVRGVEMIITAIDFCEPPQPGDNLK